MTGVRPADREHRFGHGKAEGLAALAQSVIITGSAAFVIKETFERLLNPTGVEQVGYGVAVMLISAALTLVLVGVQRYVRLRTDSTAVAADAMHYKTDLENWLSRTPCGSTRRPTEHRRGASVETARSFPGWPHEGPEGRCDSVRRLLRQEMSTILEFARFEVG